MRSWILGLVLVFLVFLVYQPAWQGAAVFDDDDHLTSPEFASAHGLWRIWAEPGAVSQYYPVTHTAFWLQNKLWGHTMLGYHLVNLSLHALCALLFFRILTRLALPGAWLATAIFALHPVQAESVAWISEQKNTLSAAFYLCTVLVWLRFDRDRRPADYVFALLLFITALLSKSVGATLPAMLLVIFWWKRGRLSWPRDILPLIPFFLIGIGSGLFTAWIERRFIGAEGSDFDLSIVQRLLIAGRAFWFYVGKLFWPTNLTFIYPRWQIDPSAWWQYSFLFLATALVTTLWIQRAKQRGLLAATLIFLGTLFPVLGFLNIYPFRYSFVADHYTYLANLNAVAAVSAGIAALSSRWPALPRPSFPILSLGILFALSILTWRQSHIYQSTETLWRDTLDKNPDCFVAHSNLGLYLHQTGRLDEAIAHLQQARTLQPAFAEIHNNLGNALRDKGVIDEARTLYETALRLHPKLAQAHYNLGALLLLQHKPQEALLHFKKAVELRPDYADARVNLAGLLLDSGRPTEALPQVLRVLSVYPENPDALTNYASALLALGQPGDALPVFEKAAAFQPNSAASQYNLAQAFLSLNRAKEAQQRLEKALVLQPDFAKAHSALGHLLLAQGDHMAAVSHYQLAIANDPDNLDTVCNLAWLLATAPDDSLRDGSRALKLAQAANEKFSGQNPLVLQVLAAAQAETNQYRQAAETIRRAIGLTDRKEVTDQLRAQLDAYESETPWRSP